MWTKSGKEVISQRKIKLLLSERKGRKEEGERERSRVRTRARARARARERERERERFPRKEEHKYLLSFSGFSVPTHTFFPYFQNLTIIQSYSPFPLRRQSNSHLLTISTSYSSASRWGKLSFATSRWPSNLSPKDIYSFLSIQVERE